MPTFVIPRMPGSRDLGSPYGVLGFTAKARSLTSRRLTEYPMRGSRKAESPGPGLRRDDGIARIALAGNLSSQGAAKHMWARG